MIKQEDYSCQLSEIDKKMAALFNERLELCKKISESKKEKGQPICHDFGKAIDKIEESSDSTDSNIASYCSTFLHSVMEISASYQEMLLNGMKISYCDSKDPDSITIVKNNFPEAEPVKYDDYKSAYTSVENGECDCAILPLTNSLSGEIGSILDLMYQGSLSINSVLSAPEDTEGNQSRYAVFSRVLDKNPIADKQKPKGFIITFTVKNEAGALASTLNIIGAHGYNMKSLRSRPLKGLAWKYYFYMEAEGDINTKDGRDMLQELSALCADLKLIGSFIDE